MGSQTKIVVVVCGAVLAAGWSLAARERGHPEPTAARVIEIDLHLARINLEEDRPRAVLLWLSDQDYAKCENATLSKCGSRLWPHWNPALDYLENYRSRVRSRKAEDHFADPRKPPAPIAVYPWKKPRRHWNYGERYQAVVKKGQAHADPHLKARIDRLARKRGAKEKHKKTHEFPIRKQDTLRCKVLDVLWGGTYSPYHTFHLLSLETPDKHRSTGSTGDRP